MLPELIRAQGLGKTYRVYGSPWSRLREALTGRAAHQAFVALDNVSFTVRAGESLGILGENGAGKSTLLKVLSGVTAPSVGQLQVRGSVASLLELGMGFHPELTGRQNIRLNAAMMGLEEGLVEAKTEQIIEFSELGTFIDRPVKTYSTGMAMRLGFAVAVQVDPDILVIDEALSVGDGYFQKKCMDRIREFLGTGKTLLFCSHAMYYVSSFCERAIWLRHGKVEAEGPVREVVRQYEAFLDAKTSSVSAASGEGNPPPERERGDRPARLVAVSFPDGESRPKPAFASQASWEIEVEWKTQDQELATHLGVGINTSAGLEVCAFATHLDGLEPQRGQTQYRLRLAIPELPLVKGTFTLYLYLLDEAGLHVYDQLVVPDAFSVESDEYQFGLLRIEHRWESSARQSDPPRVAHEVGELP